MRKTHQTEMSIPHTLLPLEPGRVAKLTRQTCRLSWQNCRLSFITRLFLVCYKAGCWSLKELSGEFFHLFEGAKKLLFQTRQTTRQTVCRVSFCLLAWQQAEVFPFY